MKGIGRQSAQRWTGLEWFRFIVIYDELLGVIGHIRIFVMGSPKVRPALERLGQDVRNARLRRGITVTDLAARAGTSPSSVSRLEKGDPGADIETLADVLVVLELALSAEHLPRRGSSFAARLRVQKAKPGQRRTGKTSSTTMGSLSDCAITWKGCSYRSQPTICRSYSNLPFFDIVLIIVV